jgi:hypothetical protein
MNDKTTGIQIENLNLDHSGRKGEELVIQLIVMEVDELMIIFAQAPSIVGCLLLV